MTHISTTTYPNTAGIRFNFALSNSNTTSASGTMSNVKPSSSTKPQADMTPDTKPVATALSPDEEIQSLNCLS